jgi:hypothetical protein
VKWNACQADIQYELHIVSVAVADEAPDLESRFFEAASEYFASLPHQNGMTGFSSGRLALLAGGLVSASRWKYPGLNTPSPAASYHQGILPITLAQGHEIQRARGGGMRPRPKVDSEVAWGDLDSPVLVTPAFPSVEAGQSHKPSSLSRYIPNDVGVVEGFDVMSITDSFGAWFVPNGGLLNPLRSGWTPRSIVQRYLDELMLSMLIEEPSSLSVLRPLVTEWAILYDDPLVERGTSVGLIVRSEYLSELLHWLGAARNFSMRMDASVLEGTWAHGEITVHQYTGVASDRTQHVAVQGDRIYIANRRTFLRHVLDASGTSSALSTSADYSWFISQLELEDGSRSGVRWFMPGRFWQKTVQPKQRVAIWRRAEARAELESVSLAALLYRWLQGKLPSQALDMVRMGLLAPEELQHQNTERIKYHPVRGVSSSWGTLYAMKPLSDVPLVAPTQSELIAYERFSRTLNQVAFFPSLGGLLSGEKDRISETLIFPAPTGLGTTELYRLFGDSRMTPFSIKNGVQVTLGLEPAAGLRSALFQLIPPKFRQLDWLGHWATLGFVNDGETTEASGYLQSLLALGKWPVLAWVDKNLSVLHSSAWFIVAPIVRPIDLANALANARTLLGQLEGLNIEFRSGPIHRSVQSIYLSVKDSQGSLLFEMHYAIVDDIFVVARNYGVLASVIDSCLSRRSKSAVPMKQGVSIDVAWGADSQHVFARRLGELFRESTSLPIPLNAQIGVRNSAEAKVWLGASNTIMSQGDKAEKETNSKGTQFRADTRLKAWKRVLDAYTGVTVGLGIFDIDSGTADSHAIRVNMKWSAR